MSKILVTGGAGYIGSHAVRQLAEAGFDAVSLDDLSQGHREAVVAGELIEGDLADETLLGELLGSGQIDAVMHFASRCSVAESVCDPLAYYQSNVADSLKLLRTAISRGVKRFILSSTCATYGVPQRLPLDEEHPQNPTHPYGRSKHCLELMLQECEKAHQLSFVCLRYFNAAGASLDGLLGESHQPETHLIPRTLSAARNGSRKISVFGDDYSTPDGTCIRDYVHVVDLAEAHVLALRWLLERNRSQCFNLGSGRGWSVLEVIEAASRVTGRPIPVEIQGRRPGDCPALVACSDRATQLLEWRPRYSELEVILESAWNWELNRRF